MSIKSDMENANVWWFSGRKRPPGKSGGRVQVWVGTYLQDKVFAHTKISQLRRGNLHLFKVPFVLIAIWPRIPREQTEPRVRGGRLL